MRDVIFPDKFKEKQKEYEKKFHDCIKKEYKNIFKKKIDILIDQIENDNRKHIENHRTHEILRSFCLYPFLHQKIENFELFLIEPYSYAKYRKKLDERFPIFDLLIGEFSEDDLKSLVFCEVKGGIRGENLSDLNDFKEKYDKISVRSILLKILKDLNPSIKNNIDKIPFHYVLAVDHSDLANYQQSVKDRNLELDIWKINSTRIKSTVNIDVIEHDGYDKENPVNYGYNSLKSKLKKKYESNEDIVQYSFKTDSFVILYFIHQYYTKLHGSKIRKDYLKELMFEQILGDFLEKDSIIDVLYKRIIKFGKKIKVIVPDKASYKFKRVDVKKYFRDYLVIKKVNSNWGMDIFNKAVKNCDAKKIFYKSLTADETVSPISSNEKDTVKKQKKDKEKKITDFIKKGT